MYFHVVIINSLIVHRSFSANIVRTPPLNMVLANLAHSWVAHAWSGRIIDTRCRFCVSLVNHNSATVASGVRMASDVAVEVGCARRIVVGVVTVGCGTGCNVYVVVFGTFWGAETHFE